MDYLKTNGPTPASEVAEQFARTPMAIRQHLYALQKQNLVIGTSVAKGRGRPTKLWSLTPASQDLFPDAHQNLAVELLVHMSAQFGKEGLHNIIDRHSQVQIKTYRAALAGCKSLSSRLLKLAEIRSLEGYMAEIQQQGSDWILIENNCPICAAARTCTRLCANELQVFQSVLGSDVRINRQEHILDGPRRCLYLIKTG